VLLASSLRDILGVAATRIDHIGSTSVPGLAAKNVIDVQVTVESDVDSALTLLSQAGWHPRQATADHLVPGEDPDPAQWAKRLLTEPTGHRRVNCHLRVEGRANQRYALLFRDYLRAHPATADAYGKYKTLAAQLPFADAGEYADLKDPVCDLIYLPAKDWAARTGWVPLPQRFAARVIAVDPADRVLLLLHRREDDAKGTWITPGGAVDPGETIAEGVSRELFEETGIKLSALDAGTPVAFANGLWRAPSGLVDTVNWFFFARVPGGDIDTSGHEPHEQIVLRESRWMTAAEIAALDSVLPLGLPDLLPRLLRGDLPAAPIHLPWRPSPP
jgi:GrpB-like predicted nucleotidyltransferase (UPF0157 family)/ADP-ribose pyrophosphatase YjhB (NUDIX family)